MGGAQGAEGRATSRARFTENVTSCWAWGMAGVSRRGGDQRHGGQQSTAGWRKDRGIRPLRRRAQKEVSGQGCPRRATETTLESHGGQRGVILESKLWQQGIPRGLH